MARPTLKYNIVELGKCAFDCVRCKIRNADTGGLCTFCRDVILSKKDD